MAILGHSYPEVAKAPPISFRGILGLHKQAETRFEYCYFALVSWPYLVEIRFRSGIQEQPLV
jgi:hypothetical protein